MATGAALRNNVTVRGNPDGPPILFLHGFGCDQTMWRFVAPLFEHDHTVVLVDHVGAGGSDASAFSPSRYESLEDYSRDVLEVCEELDLHDVALVGHSVSCMIGVLAANLEPERFASLVLVGPSPRYIDDAGYHGGFSRDDIEGLLENMDTDFLGWSSSMAPVIMANLERPELSRELTTSFCRADPEIARHFARLTFLSDNRADLADVAVPTLVLQCTDDVIAPLEVGEYVRDQTPNAEMAVLDATGHCPHLSAPAETAAAIRSFL